MAYTFRSGPRGPETGRSSTVISSDNLIRDPGTGRAAQADSSGRVTGVTRQEEARRRAAPAPLPAGAMTREEYMTATGRTEKDPYGLTKGGFARGLQALDKALGGSGLDYSGIQSLAQRNAIIDHAYEKYLNPTDMQGKLRQFLPNEIALLTDPATGARFPAQAEAVPRDLGFAGVLPGAGIAQFLMGPKTELVPMEGTFTDTESVEQQATNLMPVSYRPTENNLLNAPIDYSQLPNLLKEGVGRYFQEGKPGFPVGRGRIEPEIDLKNRRVGITYKMPIAAEFPNVNRSGFDEVQRLADSQFPVPDEEFGEAYERNRQRRVNEGLIANYLQSQPDVGVFTPPAPPPPKYDERPLATMFGERPDAQQFGGFADPLVGGTLSDLLNRQTQEQRLEQSPLPNTYSPRRMALQALLSGRRFQEI